MWLKNLRKPLSMLLVLMMLALLAIVVPRALAAMVTITPGTVWTDTQGNVIQAHGEGIIKVGTTYYWLGEDKTNGSPFQNIKCYSSTDLKNWVFVNNVLTRQSSGDLGPNRVVERPHVIYNSSTSTYVMYMHIDNSSYSERRAGVATSGSVCGNYTYRGSFKPLGHDSLDDTLFQDGTTAYFISEDRTNTQLQIYQLSADYLSVSNLVASLPQYESPAVVKIGGTYYLFGSRLTGWNTNDNQYTTATSMSGPWSSWRSFAPSGTNTCNSQTTFILPVSSSSGTTYVFLGDRWNPSNLADSRYVWLPLTMSGTTVSMSCYPSWNIDAAPAVQAPYSGTPAAIPGTIQAENYDTGGEGVAYHDTTSGNSGNTYRTDGVDVESTTDSGSGYNVGWTEAGEWQEYTVNVAAGGTYTLDARVASQSSGGTMHVEVDGVNVTGALAIPSTGGWQTWTTVTRTGISLTSGQHVMRIAEDSAGFNVNWVSLTGGGTPPATTPPPTTPPPTTPAPTTPAPTNLLTNGNAESGTSSWAVFGSGSLSANTSVVHGGSQSLLLTGRTGSWNGISQNVTSKLTSGRSYTTNVWMRTQSGTPTGKVTLAVTANGTTSYVTLAQGAVNSTGWTLLSGMATVSWTGTLSSATFYVETTAGTDSFYIDDALFQ